MIRISRSTSASSVDRCVQNRATFLLGLLLLFSLSACDDPSNVGAGLLGEDGGVPERVRLVASETGQTMIDEVSGAESSGLGFAGQVFTILTGTVDDPLLGVTETTGYIDLLAPGGTGNFREGQVISAEFHLKRNYLYGDSLAPTTLVFSEIAEDWVALERTTDSSIEISSEVFRVDINPLDTLTIFPIPEEWVRTNEDLLLNVEFQLLFNGFEIKSADPGIVMGFIADESFMRVNGTNDTLDFGISKIFTSVRRDTTQTGTIPEGRLLVRDGSAQALSINFGFDDPNLTGSVVNRAVIRLYADTLGVQTTPEHFVRPELKVLNLYGVSADGVRTLLRTVNRGIDGIFTFNSTVASTTPTLVRSIQEYLLGIPPYAYYQISTPPGENTLNPALFYDISIEQTAPEAILTLIRNE